MTLREASYTSKVLSF